MAKLIRLTAHGDETLEEWDPLKAAQGDEQQVAALQQANKIIQDARGRGDAVVTVPPGESGEAARRIEKLDFDSPDETYAILPRMVGGC